MISTDDPACFAGLLHSMGRLHRMQEGIAHEEERRIEAESSWQYAKLEIESLQTELEAAARAQSELQSKLSLQLEYAHRVCGQLLCLLRQTDHQPGVVVCRAQATVSPFLPDDICCMSCVLLNE